MLKIYKSIKYNTDFIRDKAVWDKQFGNRSTWITGYDKVRIEHNNNKLTFDDFTITCTTIPVSGIVWTVWGKAIEDKEANIHTITRIAWHCNLLSIFNINYKSETIPFQYDIMGAAPKTAATMTIYYDGSPPYNRAVIPEEKYVDGLNR